ncbi:Protein of unknown function [Oceanobacillus limi]|uniref:DUF3006 domain-containing protein n=1 Tax=Oceanobacillus limi TaxID=930131 RepID=A0A1I0AHN3_9BACI|nr:DUF3006 family protein [Oceanobacillus limi]SES93355.1 Protein of unknown function [Oceanobacillus limi]
MLGVLDRIEDNKHAVILIEELNEELIIAKEKLPEGSNVHTYFNLVQGEDGKLTIHSINEKATQEAEQQTSDIMAKLRAKKTGSKFKKK